MSKYLPATEIFSHFGYPPENIEKAMYISMWDNDEKVLERLAGLPAALELLGAKQKKFRVVVDYDPEFPKILLQILWTSP